MGVIMQACLGKNGYGDGDDNGDDDNGGDDGDNDGDEEAQNVRTSRF